ncbi:hypothetical protein B0H10DRAFT_1797142 [Mycena sp. CBHHK59/15]|nr:hypothetical protein B0H10DRAFT_1797142 [Mycena sp. CBHHK59/15]
MSTLQLIWDANTIYDLWSWTNGKTHYTARVVRRLKNDVYTVRIGPRGTEPTDVIVLKLAHGADAVADLEREAALYEQQLKPLQGAVVPQCYGFYMTKVNGRLLACLLLENCAGVPGEKVLDINGKVLRAAYALHAAGVLHGDLADGHHFVNMGRELRIVDFSTAVPHQCVHGPDGRGRHRGCVCPELAVLEDRYGHGRQC